ncbi:hypothetical protein M9H77_29737 [Catharanthus roseus]|uniref:Uncharacterized protein n=1 Tax=Catharanthus roseus TaxID=4058 RepID=A0ACB9ZX56_CATRO|nr:hypothetical protein M9H77_29737 [Catharanthus roseus]
MEYYKVEVEWDLYSKTLEVVAAFVDLFLPKRSWGTLRKWKRQKGNKKEQKQSKNDENRSGPQSNNIYRGWQGNLPSMVDAKDGQAAETLDLPWMVGLTLPSVIGRKEIFVERLVSTVAFVLEIGIAQFLSDDLT